MTRVARIAVLLCVSAWLLCGTSAIDATESTNTVPDGKLSRQAGLTNATNFPQMNERERKLLAERLQALEKLGQVPESGDIRDWQLAQQTSWWGKSIDARDFWRDRVVWLDDANELAAKRHGRFYPPMPFDDPTIPHFSGEGDVDESNAVNVDGANIRYRHTGRESAFWNKFFVTHPKPPEKIERRQLQVAETILSLRYDFEHHGNSARTTPAGLSRVEVLEKRRAFESGYPPEAFTDDALFWSYVLNRRQEYKKLSGTRPGSKVDSVEILTKGLAVDPKYLTEPSDEAVSQSVSGWRTQYVRRLRNERVDESYINAYLKAWNLKPEEVFSNAAPAQPAR